MMELPKPQRQLDLERENRDLKAALNSAEYLIHLLKQESRISSMWLDSVTQLKTCADMLTDALETMDRKGLSTEQYRSKRTAIGGFLISQKAMFRAIRLD